MKQLEITPITKEIKKIIYKERYLDFTGCNFMVKQILFETLK